MITCVLKSIHDWSTIKKLVLALTLEWLVELANGLVMIVSCLVLEVDWSRSDDSRLRLVA